MGLSAGLSAAVGLLGAKAMKSPKAPTLAPPAVMPTPDDDSVRAAKRRRIAEMQARGGRASTILSADEKLGG